MRLLLQALLLAFLPPIALSITSPKRGLCHVPTPEHPEDDLLWTTTPSADLSWYYNYQWTPSSSYEDDPQIQFVPMLWGASEASPGTHFHDYIENRIKTGHPVPYVLGFNEPDAGSAVGGSSLSAALAATTWKTQLEPLRKQGVKVGAPAVTGGPSGWTWLDEFFKECDGGCKPDFFPVHWYGNFEGMASHIGQVVDKYNTTVWVTEWGYPHQDLNTTKKFVRESLDLFDRWE